MRKLATVGDNCIDYYTKQNKVFPGGNCVNVAVYAARAGLASSYTGAVGNDEYGSFMRDALRKKGVDDSHLYVLAGKTAVTRVELINGERVFGDYDEGVLRDYKMSDADVDFFCTHDLLHTALWGNAERELKRIKERGLPVVFDFATAKDGEIMETALPFVDYAFFSREEETGELLEYMQDTLKKRPPAGGGHPGRKRKHCLGRRGILSIRSPSNKGSGFHGSGGFLHSGLLQRDY
jgi:fructoselysine 6-kinase